MALNNRFDDNEIPDLVERLDFLGVPRTFPGTNQHLTLWDRASYLWQNFNHSKIPFDLKASSDGRDLLVGVDPSGAQLIVPGPPQILTPDSALAPEAPAYTLTAGQAKAWAKLQKFMVSRNQHFLLRGYSGTGKTWMIRKLLEEGASGQQVILAATTNKAAKVMTQMLGRKARTIYSVLGIKMAAEDENLVLQYPDRPPKGLYDLTIVIDEASMIGRELLHFIVRASHELNLKIIFVGDPAQLRPVGEVRSPVWSLVRDPECRALLTEVKRYDDQLLVLATAIRTAIKSRSYDIDVRDYRDQEKVICLSGPKFERTILKAGDKARVLAWRNRTVDYFNDLIRANLGFNAPYCVGDILMAAAPISINDEVVANIDDEFRVLEVIDDAVRTNSNDGQMIPCWRLVSDFDGSSIVLTVPTPKGQRVLDSQLATLAADAKASTNSWGRRLLWKQFWELKNKFNKVRYGQAMTVHRAQGSTFVDVFVDQQDILANSSEREAHQCLYVATTRASTRLFLN